jgi:hypothetical protein
MSALGDSAGAIAATTISLPIVVPRVASEVGERAAATVVEAPTATDARLLDRRAVATPEAAATVADDSTEHDDDRIEETILGRAEILGGPVLESPEEAARKTPEEFFEDQARKIANLLEQFEAMLERIDRVIEDLAKGALTPADAARRSLGELFEEAEQLFDVLEDATASFVDPGASSPPQRDRAGALMGINVVV